MATIRMATETRVWLVDDDEGLRDQFARALELVPNGPRLTGCFETARDALRALAQGAELDVALIGLGLPELAARNLIGEFRRSRPAASLLAFSARNDDAAVFSALRAGAHGYLTKDASLDDVLHAIEDVVGGGAPLSRGISLRVVAHFWQDSATEWSPVDTLTLRERSVLEVLCTGATYREASMLLGVSEGTIQTHIKNLYDKLGVCSKAEAVRMACEAGLGQR